MKGVWLYVFLMIRVGRRDEVGVRVCRVQWVVMGQGTQMCDCESLKPCQALLCRVATLTESVLLRVRTNAGLPDPS